MAIFKKGKRTIEVDIVANNKASESFKSVGTDAGSFASRVNNSIINVNRSLRQYNNAMHTFHRSTQIALAGSGYLFYRFTKDSVKEFAEFERQHGKTMGAIASNYGKTAKEQKQFIQDQKQLKEQSLSLGTIGPNKKGSLYDPKQIAFAQTALAKAGMKNDEIAKSTPQILKFAGGNDIDIETAAEYAVNISKQWDIPIKKLGVVLDKITRTADISTIDVPDIFESMKYAGGIGSSLGRELEEVLGMIAIMGNAGIRGSMTGTGIQSFFTKILAPRGMKTAPSTAPSDYALQSYKAFLKETIDPKTGKFQDAPHVTEMLNTVMQTMNDKEKAWFAYKLFGLFQMKSGFMLAKNGGDTMQGVIDDIKDNAPGTNDRKWDIMLNTSWGRQTALSNALTGIKTDIGYRLSPLTNAIVDELFAVLNNKGNYTIDFSKLEDAIKNASELMTEQYGQHIGELTLNAGNLLIKGAQTVGASTPLVTGTATSITQLLSGDVTGAIETFEESMSQVNENIDDLPPELQEMATQVRNVITALLALSGINFTTKLLENITTLWKLTIGKVVSASKMNVTAGTVILKDTGVLNKEGKPVYKPVATETTPKRTSSTIVGSNGIPVQGGGQVTTKPILDKRGNPIVATGTTNKVTKSASGIKGKALKGASAVVGMASKGMSIYMLAEALGINDKILDKIGVKGEARETVDKGRGYADAGLSAYMVDKYLLGGIGKKAVTGAGKNLLGIVAKHPVAVSLVALGTSIGFLSKALTNLGESANKYQEKLANAPALDLNSIKKKWQKELPNQLYQYQELLPQNATKQQIDEYNKRKGRYNAYRTLSKKLDGKPASYMEYMVNPDKYKDYMNGDGSINFTKFFGQSPEQFSANLISGIAGKTNPVINVEPKIDVNVRVDKEGNITTNMNYGQIDEEYRKESARVGGGLPTWMP